MSAWRLGRLPGSWSSKLPSCPVLHPALCVSNCLSWHLDVLSWGCRQLDASLPRRRTDGPLLPTPPAALYEQCRQFEGSFLKSASERDNIEFLRELLKQLKRWVCGPPSCGFQLLGCGPAAGSSGLTAGGAWGGAQSTKGPPQETHGPRSTPSPHGCRSHKAAVFVLDDFDLFAKRNKQVGAGWGPWPKLCTLEHAAVPAQALDAWSCI